MSARKGNRNALKNKWCIIKGVSEDGKVQYEVSDDVIDMYSLIFLMILKENSLYR